MRQRMINAADAPAPASSYAQAVEVSDARRLLFVSGQIGVAADGTLADGFAPQCRQAWANLHAQLRAAGLDWDNLVKVTVIMPDREHLMESRAVRREVLGDRTPASTAVIAGLFDPAWLIEIEAVAAG